MPKRDPAKLKKVSISLPFGLGSAEWESDPTERNAAWELYVELVTRVAVQPIGEGEGLIGETLLSLYSLFSATRDILHQSGPGVGAAITTVGGLAIAVLNKGLRPFLTKWHPRHQAWEAQRPKDVAVQDYEESWAQHQAFCRELATLRGELEKYALALATIAGVGP
jgi:hypothetical protein